MTHKTRQATDMPAQQCDPTITRALAAIGGVPARTDAEGYAALALPDITGALATNLTVEQARTSIAHLFAAGVNAVVMPSETCGKYSVRFHCDGVLLSGRPGLARYLQAREFFVLAVLHQHAHNEIDAHRAYTEAEYRVQEHGESDGHFMRGSACTDFLKAQKGDAVFQAIADSVAGEVFGGWDKLADSTHDSLAAPASSDIETYESLSP